MEATDYRYLGIDANMETWALLQKVDLTVEEQDQMVAAAYASHYLWQKSGLGTAVHAARGHWLISRVLCILKDRERAEHHAMECSRFTNLASDREPFDDIYAIEALARSYALARNENKAAQLRAEALRLAEALADPDSRTLAISDIQSEPWFGV